MGDLSPFFGLFSLDAVFLDLILDISDEEFTKKDCRGHQRAPKGVLKPKNNPEARGFPERQTVSNRKRAGELQD